MSLFNFRKFLATYSSNIASSPISSFFPSGAFIRLGFSHLSSIISYLLFNSSHLPIFLSCILG